METDSCVVPNCGLVRLIFGGFKSPFAVLFPIYSDVLCYPATISEHIMPKEELAWSPQITKGFLRSLHKGCFRSLQPHSDYKHHNRLARHFRI